MPFSVSQVPPKEHLGLFPADYLAEVKNKPDTNREFEKQVGQFETTESIRHALDRSYQRMRIAARRHWERHFLHRLDPADACVNVRINNVQVRAVRGSGFLKAGKIATRKAFRCPRFAQ